ncbi:hypothetical protein CYMTET_6876 [Cymbomonas tetramitiformis]|uniref:Reverse transcriptase Ty1/copia-type domain-containing protein n=1 Tax=Cymbomonas tetramitiformis TaxID=36881 RepID=A0AAE0GWK8_9CHLO|nr:hypothetical protein CYMTET_6876 [Cymbomonas tetramitiformis]
MALNLGQVVYHMDADTAFLNSVLEEDLYVRLPPGIVYGGHRCAKLLKAVYGRKQAGREWFDTSDAFIMGYDSRMQRSDVEPCLYFIKGTELMVIILAYADDYLVATNVKSWYDTFVATFHSRYACKDLGILILVMGIGVRWGDDPNLDRGEGARWEEVEGLALMARARWEEVGVGADGQGSVGGGGGVGADGQGSVGGGGGLALMARARWEEVEGLALRLGGRRWRGWRGWPGLGGRKWRGWR